MAVYDFDNDENDLGDDFNDGVDGDGGLDEDTKPNLKTKGGRPGGKRSTQTVR